MWPKWEKERQRIVSELQKHSQKIQPLPGLADQASLNTLALQIVASLRRETYYRELQKKAIAAERANPNHPSFDAERAVVHLIQTGDIDEALWLIFLMTHFAKPADSGWLRLRDVYGKLGEGKWTWKSVVANPAAFEHWLAQNCQSIRGKFGNHRKYESLRGDSSRGTGKVVASYLSWIGSQGHAAHFASLIHASGNDPHSIFDGFYRNLQIKSFGRLAKFDYLSLVGRYGLAPIDAGSAYLEGATGPLKGVKLLFDGDPNANSSIEALQNKLDLLDADLKVTMKVLEDALCNWQKSPKEFVHFKG